MRVKRAVRIPARPFPKRDPSMRLTTFTDYSLRVLMFVATHPEGRTTIAEIARTYGISEHHLTKVVHFLGKRATSRTSAAAGAGSCWPGPRRRSTWASW